MKKKRRRIEADLNTIDEDFVNWEQKRNDLRKKIPDDLLAKYEKIKNRNNGVGVISVWKADMQRLSYEYSTATL